MPKQHDLTNSKWFQRRITQLSIFSQVLVVILLSRLWFLQIVKGSHFEKRARENHLRLIPLKAPRGLIFDRQNRLLVNNRPVYTVSVIPQGVVELSRVLQDLSQLFNVPEAELQAKIAKQKARPFQPVKLIPDIGMREMSVLAERKINFPGVIIETEHQRGYLFTHLAAHLLGYVGEVSEQLLGTPGYENLYPGDQIGQVGLEKSFETYLHGQQGGRQVEINAFGQELRTLFTQKPAPGNNLILNLDLNLQQAAETALGELPGAIVALNPNNGEVLAMVSHPDFDPNLFAGGISTAQWQKLSANPSHPLLNRVISNHYPPGSIFKVLTATAGLEEKTIGFDDQFYCGGSFRLGSLSFNCWKVEGHGSVNVEEAIMKSCNVFFFNVAYRLGIQKQNEYAFRYRLGEKTGVELNNEIKGLIPTPAWKKTINQGWYPGDTVQFAIGQGEILVTPLQMLNVYAAIANGGTIYQPQLVKRITTVDGQEIKRYQPRVLGSIDVSKKTLDILRLSLWKTVNNFGTGSRTFIKGADICGKTGTAQVADLPYDEKKKEEVPSRLRPHAWFVSFAPYKDPQIALLVLLEHGGEGSSNAVPVAKKVYEEFFKDKKLDPQMLQKYRPAPISHEAGPHLAELTGLAEGLAIPASGPDLTPPPSVPKEAAPNVRPAIN